MHLTSENALARAVRAARKEAGLSQQEVAERAGMSRVWVARLEGGEANVTLDSLLRVASVVGMNLEATWDPGTATKSRLPRKRTQQRKAEPATVRADVSTARAEVAATTSRLKRTQHELASKKRPDAPVRPVTPVNLNDVLARVTK
jgi:transcriptional regulator with XRE-family HTH domain